MTNDADMFSNITLNIYYDDDRIRYRHAYRSLGCVVLRIGGTRVCMCYVEKGICVGDVKMCPSLGVGIGANHVCVTFM